MSLATVVNDIYILVELVLSQLNSRTLRPGLTILLELVKMIEELTRTGFANGNKIKYYMASENPCSGEPG